MTEPICKHCKIPMQPDGIALIPNLSGIPDFEDGCVVTVSPDGTARQIECFKCLDILPALKDGDSYGTAR